MIDPAQPTDETRPAEHGGAKPLTPAARRALAEAGLRRQEQEARESALAAAREIDGRGGRDPVRYVDWEVKGLASDF